MRNESRAQLSVGLQPGAFVVAFQREDPENDPNFNYHGLHFHLEADSLNGGDVTVVVQDSRDGTTWSNRYESPVPVVPGGHLDVSTYLQGRYHRTLVYSAGTGRADIVVLIPEEQVLPGLWPDVASLACHTNCEVISET